MNCRYRKTRTQAWPIQFFRWRHSQAFVRHVSCLPQSLKRGWISTPTSQRASQLQNASTPFFDPFFPLSFLQLSIHFVICPDLGGRSLPLPSKRAHERHRVSSYPGGSHSSRSIQSKNDEQYHLPFPDNLRMSSSFPSWFPNLDFAPE